jgi:hypothetical protein
VANSIFIGQLASSSGGTINPSLPIAFPDGAINAPSITFANDTTMGFMRAGAGLMDFGVSVYSASVPLVRFQGSAGIIIGNGVGLGFTNGSGAAGTITGFFANHGAGLMNLSTTAAESTGVGFDVATDAVFKIRTRAQTGYATVDALGYKVSGTAGANFGPSAVASLTVVNGLVTAAS